MTWVYKIPTDSTIKLYATREWYGSDSDWTIFGTKQNGEFVKYLDTLNITEKYFGIKIEGGASPIVYDVPKCSGDTIVIPYRNRNGRDGEFRFKWDDAAQWFSVEQVKYSESQVAASQAQTYVEQGENLYKSGKHSEALAKYNQAISLNPNLAEAYIARSVVLYVDSRTVGTPEDQTRAMNDINRAIELNPNSARAYRWRATMNIYKNPNGALADINRAIQIDSQYLDAYETRAQIYSDMKKYDQAIADYTYILNSPNFKTSYMQHYDFDMMSDWAWYIDFDQRTAALYNRRANVYAEKGDYDAAISDYNKALKLSPRNDWIKNRLRQAEEKKSGR